MPAQTYTQAVPRLIALTGFARSGKDAVAAHLVAHRNFTRVAFADGVREAALALDPVVDYADGQAIRISALVGERGWDEAKAHPEVRRTLQRLGTEAGWNLHGPSLWVDLARPKIQEAWDSGRSAVITDMRFPAEVEWVSSVGGRVWKVRRPRTGASLTGENAAHTSEAFIDRIEADVVIDNDADLVALYRKVDAAIGADSLGSAA
ncbi:hypothetical protein [Mycolicibacterium sp.]|uniref:deoxynucleotide monophosphate kinase family protein n=1 Tax=Mycolicibacterium sp. TaxID=2320850 RepID=UPI00355F9CA4